MRVCITLKNGSEIRADHVMEIIQAAGPSRAFPSGADLPDVIICNINAVESIDIETEEGDLGTKNHPAE